MQKSIQPRLLFATALIRPMDIILYCIGRESLQNYQAYVDAYKPPTHGMLLKNVWKNPAEHTRAFLIHSMCVMPFRPLSDHSCFPASSDDCFSHSNIL